MYDLLDTLNPEKAFASLSGFSATSLYPGDPGFRDTLDVGLNGGVPDYIYFRHVDEEALLVKSPEELSSHGSYVYSDTFSDRESEFTSFEYGLERINIHSDYGNIAQSIADPVSAGLILPMVPEELYPYVGIEFSQDGGFTFAIGYEGDGDLPIPAMHSEVQIGGDGLLFRLEGKADGSSYSVDFDYNPSFERKTDLGFGPSIDDDDVFDILGLYPEDPDNFFFEYGALRLDIEGDDDSLPAFLKGLRSATVYLVTPGWAPVYLCLEGNDGEPIPTTRPLATTPSPTYSPTGKRRRSQSTWRAISWSMKGPTTSSCSAHWPRNGFIPLTITPHTIPSYIGTPFTIGPSPFPILTIAVMARAIPASRSSNIAK